MRKGDSVSDYLNKLNRLAKWRGHFAGWQLGTRPSYDAECQAVRDHREATIILRAEVTGLVALLIEKGVFTTAEFEESVGREADLQAMGYEARWPGARATDAGMEYDLARAQSWLQNWRP